MSSINERERIAEWDQYPTIESFVDPNWQQRPERLSRKLTGEDLLATAGGVSDAIPPELLQFLRRKGLVLDVGCGLNVQGEKFGVTTPVGQIPNAYGIDPIFAHFRQGLPGRTLAAYAEDMPFQDNVFKITMSMKGLGWYAGAAFNPYWAIREMIRVTAPEGLVSIAIGSGGGAGSINRVSFEQNYSQITDAISRIQGEDFGRAKIGQIHDFTAQASPQVNIVLK